MAHRSPSSLFYTSNSEIAPKKGPRRALFLAGSGSDLALIQIDEDPFGHAPTEAETGVTQGEKDGRSPSDEGHPGSRDDAQIG